LLSLPLLWLSKPYTWTAAVFIDELDAGGFEGGLDGEEGAGMGVSVAVEVDDGAARLEQVANAARFKRTLIQAVNHDLLGSSDPRRNEATRTGPCLVPNKVTALSPMTPIENWHSGR